MRQRPSLNIIIELLLEILKALNDSRISYLVYGSYAYQLYSNDENVQINDIDIIVNQSDFKKIQNLFEERHLPYRLFVSEFAIHANHIQEMGNDNKPFDISFDSYDRYFAKYDININKFAKKNLSDAVIARIIKKEDLMKIYIISANDNTNSKAGEYKVKFTRLKSKK